MLTVILGSGVVLVIFLACRKIGTSRSTYLVATLVPLLAAFTWLTLIIDNSDPALPVPGYVLALLLCGPLLVLALVLGLFVRKKQDGQ